VSSPPPDIYSLIRFEGGPFDTEWRRIEQDSLNQDNTLTFFVPSKGDMNIGCRATYQWDHTDT
jgi:hypothetical protein